MRKKYHGGKTPSFYHGTPLETISNVEFGVPTRMLDKKQEQKVKKIYREIVNPDVWRYSGDTPSEFRYKKRK